MRQKCTYWGRGAWSADGGGYAAAAPVLLDCRWQEQQKLVRSTGGLEVMASAVVYLAQAVGPVGSLMEGDETAHQTPPAGAGTILATGRATTVSGTTDHWKAWVQ